MTSVDDLTSLYDRLVIEHAEHVPLFTTYLRALVDKVGRSVGLNSKDGCIFHVQPIYDD